MRSRHKTTALTVVIGLCTALLFGVPLSTSKAATEYRNRQDGVATTIPGGWHVIAHPITSVTYPVQVLAAATYADKYRGSPRSCTPREALSIMPADGVLLQVVEYASRTPNGKPVKAPDLPPRPRHFTYGAASYGRFECAGPSYKFEFSMHGRAFQAQVWMHRGRVSPVARRQVLGILDGLRILDGR